MKTNEIDISRIIKLLEAIYHELKESCPGHYSPHELSCIICEYSDKCRLEFDNEDQ